MTFSDANPIQFWLISQDSFNESISDECGLANICWCQPFNCDDDIVLQFKAASGSYSLTGLDQEGNIVIEGDFSEVSTGVFQINFNDAVNSPAELCGLDVYFQIKDSSIPPTQYLSNNSFTAGTLSPWTQDGSGTTWSINTGAQCARLTLTGTNTDTQRIYQIISLPNKTYRVLLTYSFAGFNGINSDGTIKVYINDGTTVNLVHTETNIITKSTTSTFVVDFLYTGPITGAYFIFTRVDTTINNQISLYDFSIYSEDSANIKAKSDCVSFRENHECSQLISYSNSKTFADLVFTDDTPSPNFYVRIPAVFFHEQYPQEEENIELSNENYVRLHSEIKRKKLLEIGYMPYYMHRKMNLILAMDDVTIDGEEWIKQDAYEIADGNKHYPLKRANVLLTDKNYIKRNIL